MHCLHWLPIYWPAIHGCLNAVWNIIWLWIVCRNSYGVWCTSWAVDFWSTANEKTSMAMPLATKDDIFPVRKTHCGTAVRIKSTDSVSVNVESGITLTAVSVPAPAITTLIPWLSPVCVLDQTRSMYTHASWSTSPVWSVFLVRTPFKKGSPCM